MKKIENIANGLQGNIRVPKIVNSKYNDALKSISCEAADANTATTNPEYEKINNNRLINKNNKLGWLRLHRAAAAVIAAVMLGAGAVAAAAVITNWNNGLSNILHVDETDMQYAQDSGLADAGMTYASVTDQGITVSVETCLADNYNAYVAFQISGLETPEGKHPDADIAKLTIGSRDDFGWSAGFYNGWFDDGNGMAINKEGVYYADAAAAGELEYEYLDEEGNYTYIMFINGQERGEFLGKEISVTFDGFGYASGKAETEILYNGNWNLTWNLDGAGDSKEIHTDQALGNTGAVVKEIEISPLSIRVLMDWPKNTHIEEGINVDGYPANKEVYDEPPFVAGIRMKDGTVKRGLGGGSFGYTGFEGSDDTDWEEIFGLNFIVDVDNVDAVLFFNHENNESPEDGQDQSYYVVPIA